MTPQQTRRIFFHERTKDGSIRVDGSNPQFMGSQKLFTRALRELHLSLATIRSEWEEMQKTRPETPQPRFHTKADHAPRS